MNINATLIGQSITFFFFVWFCMKFVWPPIMQALDARKKQIADGLAAGERGKHEQELAQKRAAEILVEAKRQAQEIIAKAESGQGSPAQLASLFRVSRSTVQRVLRAHRERPSGATPLPAKRA